MNLRFEALLIQKSIKQEESQERLKVRFESFVNSEEYQTNMSLISDFKGFESFVNSEEYQTRNTTMKRIELFESFVNSEEYQTIKIN